MRIVCYRSLHFLINISQNHLILNILQMELLLPFSFIPQIHCFSKSSPNIYYISIDLLQIISFKIYLRTHQMYPFLSIFLRHLHGLTQSSHYFLNSITASKQLLGLLFLPFSFLQSTATKLLFLKHNFNHTTPLF